MTMALQRKIRRAGHSVVVTLPSQLAELADLAEGDVVGLSTWVVAPSGSRRFEDPRANRLATG